MNNEIKISVVIPAYNRKATIINCLHSVLNQTYKPSEIIVVDDCSTDNTVELVKSLNNSLIRCIKLEKNSGAQAARNEGIKAAKYDWIALNDSDDEWLPQRLEKGVEALQQNNFDSFTVVYSNWVIYDHYKNTKIKFELQLNQNKSDYKHILKYPGPAFQSMLTSKTAFEKINYNDINTLAYDEWDTSIRLAKYCKFIHIQEPLFIYNLHKGDTISKNNKRNILGLEYVLNKHKNDITNICGIDTWYCHQYFLLNNMLQYNITENFEKYFSKIKFLKTREIFNIAFCKKYNLKPSTFNKIDKYLWYLTESIFIIYSKGFNTFIKKLFRRK